MTRTAVRRHVDLEDGRLVIRKIVVETSQGRDAGAVEEPRMEPRSSKGGRVHRLRHLKPAAYSGRVWKTHRM